MVKAWYLVNDANDEKGQGYFPEYLTIKELHAKTGVEYRYLNVDTIETDGVLDQIKKERGNSYEDELLCTKQDEDYEEKIKVYCTEHLHADEEMRLVLEGSGYIDVRDSSDRWIRIAVSTGDFVIVPEGLYHRFHPDINHHIRFKRFYVEEPKWIGYNRPADHVQARKQHIEKIQNGGFKINTGFATACYSQI